MVATLLAPQTIDPNIADSPDSVFIVEAAATGIDALDALRGQAVTIIEKGVDSDLQAFVVVKSCDSGLIGMFYNCQIKPFVQR